MIEWTAQQFGKWSWNHRYYRQSSRLLAHWTSRGGGTSSRGRSVPIRIIAPTGIARRREWHPAEMRHPVRPPQPEDEYG